MKEYLTRSDILAALKALAAECKARGITGEICIYGGAEMVLVFDAREATRDVDAVFRPKSELAEAARRVAEQLDLPPDWLNDGVKGFISGNEELQENVVAGLSSLPHLRVVWPSAQYLLAMKCMAARAEDDQIGGDRRDVKILLAALKMTSEEEVMQCVERFYPAERIHIKTRYFVAEIFAEFNSP